MDYSSENREPKKSFDLQIAIVQRAVYCKSVKSVRNFIVLNCGSSKLCEAMRNWRLQFSMSMLVLLQSFFNNFIIHVVFGIFTRQHSVVLEKFVVFDMVKAEMAGMMQDSPATHTRTTLQHFIYRKKSQHLS